MGGRVAVEQGPESGVVRERAGAPPHPVDQAPAELELEELAEDVDHAVERVGGVGKGLLRLDPVEEVEGPLPLVVVTGERVGDSFWVQSAWVCIGRGVARIGCCSGEPFGVD